MATAAPPSVGHDGATRFSRRSGSAGAPRAGTQPLSKSSSRAARCASAFAPGRSALHEDIRRLAATEETSKQEVRAPNMHLFHEAGWKQAGGVLTKKKAGQREPSGLGSCQQSNKN